MKFVEVDKMKFVEVEMKKAEGLNNFKAKINPDNICYIRENMDGKTEIYFNNGEYCLIEYGMEDFIKELKEISELNMW